MTKVTAQMSVSLDGFYAGPRDTRDPKDMSGWMQGPEAPGFFRVNRWVLDAMAWRERQAFAGGERSINSEIIEQTFAAAGAYVMGRRMFDAGEIPWGDDPPFRARGIVRHLLELGHTRLAIVSYELGPGRRQGLAGADRLRTIAFGGTRERLGGYRTALAAAGLDWPTTPIYECDHNGRQPGREAAAELLGGRRRPTAIVAMSDELAMGVLEAAHDAGLEVPRHLSVVGYDDTPGAAVTTPPLTTVRQPLRTKGEQAGRRLLALRDGRPVGRSRRLPTEVVVRASTAPPRRAR